MRQQNWKMFIRFFLAWIMRKKIMMCPNCHRTIANDSIFCQFCGCRLTNNQNYNTQQVKYTVSITTLWIIYVVILILMGNIIIAESETIFIDNTNFSDYNLTLEKAVELSEKGQDLTWSDFDYYWCEKETYYTDSKYQERIYNPPYPYTFEVLVSGLRGDKPEEIILQSDKNSYNHRIDLRKTEEVKEFIKKHKEHLVTE